MREPVDVPCPACRHPLRVPWPELHLPPTGGDIDWAESVQLLRCGGCREPFEVHTRNWLESAVRDVLSVRRPPPTPSPWRPGQMALAPGGRALAVFCANGLWRVERGTEGWAAPRHLAPHPGWCQGGDTVAWARDGRLALAGATGEVHGPDGVASFALCAPRSRRGFGWTRDGVLAICTRPPGLIVWDGTRRSRSFEVTDAYSMNGLLLTDPARPDFWTLEPTFHGATQWHVSRWVLDRGKAARGARKKIVGDVVAATVDGEVLWVVVGRHRPGVGHVYEVQQRDATLLESRAERPLPRRLDSTFPYQIVVHRGRPLLTSSSGVVAIADDDVFDLVARSVACQGDVLVVERADGTLHELEPRPGPIPHPDS